MAQAFCRALKAGGVRRPSKSKPGCAAPLAEAAFDRSRQPRSDASPKNAKALPDGVWTFPLRYALGDLDRSTQAVIGGLPEG